jgi:nucleoside-diphosphate-sugar epimerase
MRRILVTGAGGYIGSVLTRLLLEEGSEIIAVDRFFFGRDKLPDEAPRLTILERDIRSLERETFDGVDAVVDLAALSNDPAGELAVDKTWSINHSGRVRVATLAKEAGVERYILPSSCSIYGFQEGILDEHSPVDPLTTYAQANYRAEQDILPLADERFCVTVIRQATVYGFSPRMRYDVAVNGMTRGAFRDGVLPILRDGKQWRPFVHVRDTSRAMMTILSAPRDVVNGELFNVGSDEQNVQVLPLAERVAESLDRDVKMDWYGSPDHRSYRVSFEKIVRVLGFRAERSLEDGTREVYAALSSGESDADDPRTITVDWYRRLLEKDPELL